MATQVAVDDLESWLQSKPANTVDTPYEIEVTGITSAKLSVFSQGLYNNLNKYVDLSETQMPLSGVLAWYLSGQTSIVEPPKLPSGLTTMSRIFQGCTALKHGVTEIPEGITSMSEVYEGCTSLVSAIIPEGITDLGYTFKGCTSLTEAPVIPNGVTVTSGTFNGCSSLTTAPELPSTVVNIREIFKNCTSLIYAPLLPNGVSFADNAFENCSALREKPILPSSVTYSTDCFKGVTTSNWKGTESQAESFLSTFFAQTVDSELQVYNNDRVTYEESIYNIDISTLSAYLAGLDPNTASTAYKIYIRGLTTSNASDIKTALTANQYPRKYVDLEYTTIPESTDCTDLFRGCTTLVKSAILPTNATSLIGTFRQTSLRTAPSIPSGVTDMTQTFYADALMQNAPTIPNGVTTLEYTFLSCEGITTPPAIPSSVTNMRYTFAGCNGLTTAPVIPEGVTDITSCFEKIYDESVNFTSISVIPSTVTKGENAFKGCTSLTKIDEFKIPLNTLKNNSDFHNMFAGCTSLESIGFKIDTDTWHAWRLKFDANSVEGKIFGFNNGQLTSTAVLNTQISKNDIRLPVLTDELWFPPANMSDSDVEDVIRSVLNNRYTYWNKAVIDPNSKSLVMMASDPNNVVSNFLNGGGGGGVEKLVISTTRSVNVTKDTRIFADGSAITITLNYGFSAEGYVAEVYAIQACTITYYTAQGTTTSLAMEAGGKAIFVYFSGWKLHSNYGTTNSVTVDNMQSVSSNAVAQALQSYITTDFLSRYLIQKTTFYLTDNGTSTFNIPNNECYLFMNIHALVNPQICLVRLYQGVLRVSTIMAGANNVAITYVSGSTVQFKATGNCRGYLWKFNGAGTT